MNKSLVLDVNEKPSKLKDYNGYSDACNQYEIKEINANKNR